MSVVQVLVAAVNENKDLLNKLNIQTDAIVGNQCNENNIEDFNYNENKIKWLSFDEKGVGLNRNNCLMRASGKYCLFSDDDMVYVNDYEKKVIEAFNNNPEADVIIFNLIEKKKTRFVIQKKTKVNYFNYLRYGTARIAIKLESIKRNGIFFNLCFGGGTEHRHGEDNLFLNQCLKKGLRIVAIPENIAYLTEERESSWNKGYDEKYFLDQGFLYKCISNHFWKLLCLQDVLRHRSEYLQSGKTLELYKTMILGGKQ